MGILVRFGRCDTQYLDGRSYRSGVNTRVPSWETLHHKRRPARSPGLWMREREVRQYDGSVAVMGDRAAEHRVVSRLAVCL